MFFQILKIKMDFELDNQHIAYCILSALPFQKIPECIDNAILRMPARNKRARVNAIVQNHKMEASIVMVT